MGDFTRERFTVYMPIDSHNFKSAGALSLRFYPRSTATFQLRSCAKQEIQSKQVSQLKRFISHSLTDCQPTWLISHINSSNASTKTGATIPARSTPFGHCTALGFKRSFKGWHVWCRDSRKRQTPQPGRHTMNSDAWAYGEVGWGWAGMAATRGFPHFLISWCTLNVGNRKAEHIPSESLLGLLMMEKNLKRHFVVTV